MAVAQHVQSAIQSSPYRTPDNPKGGKIPKSAIFGPVGWTKNFLLRPDFGWISNLTSKFSPIRVDEVSDLSFPNILHTVIHLLMIHRN
jgi:hypothetical protein